MADIDAIGEGVSIVRHEARVKRTSRGHPTTLGVGIALGLMRAALYLLDRAGASLPAIHLSHAIEVASGTPTPRTVAEMDAALAALPPARFR